MPSRKLLFCPQQDIFRNPLRVQKTTVAPQNGMSQSQFSKYITIMVDFIIKMHYISCFLNPFGGGKNWNNYYDLCKNKNKVTKSLPKQNRTQRLVVVAETEPMISFQTIRSSNPHPNKKKRNKYHAINSVYYSFSIQVYITFLSIHIHTVIHIVLFLSFSLYFFHC